jgi:hypothetical protein
VSARPITGPVPGPDKLADRLRGALGDGPVVLVGHSPELPDGGRRGSLPHEFSAG